MSETHELIPFVVILCSHLTGSVTIRVIRAIRGSQREKDRDTPLFDLDIIHDFDTITPYSISGAWHSCDREKSSPTTAAFFAILCAGDPPDGLVHCFGGYFHLKENR